jgi:solute carrier family 13 (sodium-dependent dicarboxylate transporter), member 2/3/5
VVEPADAPDDVSASAPAGRRRLWPVAAAVLLCALGVLIAPQSWPSGPAELEVVVDGGAPIRQPIELGSTEEIVLVDETGGVTTTIVLPDGAPTSGKLTVEVSESDRPNLSVADVAVNVVLADGTVELVPVLAASDGVVEAARRPPDDSAVVLGLLGVVIVLWITEFFPLFVTSLAIPVVLVAFEASTASAALAPFFDPIIVLFFAGFIMAEAMHRTRLDHWAATTIVAVAGTSPVRLFATMLATSAFMSMWMSNTASVAALLPVAIAVTAAFGEVGFQKATVLGIAYAATIGGVGSAIGTPANQLAIRFTEDLTGRQISFVEWFAFGLPMVVLFLPVMGVYLWWSSGARVAATDFATAHAAAVAERANLGGFTREQSQVLAVFGAVVALWLTQTWHGVNPGIIALGGAVVLFAIGRALPVDLGRISWETLLTFGGGLTLGVAMIDSGTADWIVTRLGEIDAAPIVAVGVVAIVSLIVTTVASNTASAAMLIPLAVPLAGLVGVDPVLLAATVAIASSIDFALVIGTPPTMLAYSTDLFTPAEILRKGAPLDLIGVLILVLGVTTFWRLVGIV